MSCQSEGWMMGAANSSKRAAITEIRPEGLLIVPKSRAKLKNVWNVLKKQISKT